MNTMIMARAQLLPTEAHILESNRRKLAETHRKRRLPLRSITSRSSSSSPSVSPHICRNAQPNVKLTTSASSGECFPSIPPSDCVKCENRKLQLPSTSRPFLILLLFFLTQTMVGRWSPSPPQSAARVHLLRRRGLLFMCWPSLDSLLR